jgi:hypothetical protein
MNIRGYHVMKVPSLLRWHVFTLDKFHYLATIVCKTHFNGKLVVGKLEYYTSTRVLPYNYLPDAVESCKEAVVTIKLKGEFARAQEKGQST